MQYHPESVLDPVADLNSNKSRINFLIAQAFSNFFASECDKNDNQFTNAQLWEVFNAKAGFRG